MTYFSQAAPDDFGAFNKAFVALFRITAGDAWIESLPAHGPDGWLNPGSVMYQLTYVLIVNWTLLPIRWDRLGRPLDRAGRGAWGGLECHWQEEGKTEKGQSRMMMMRGGGGGG